MSRLRSCVLAFSLLVAFHADSAYCEPITVAEQYENFGERVRQVISGMKGVTQSKTEYDDMRALDYLLGEYDKAVHAQNWKQAYSIGKSMKVYLTRAKVVAGESRMRKEARARADAERRHQEDMQQRERHHQEEMFMDGIDNDHVKLYLWRMYGI